MMVLKITLPNQRKESLALYDSTQYLNDAFDYYRRGRAEILNPERLVITVDGSHSKYDRYVKFSGDSYELAEIQITGSYGGPSRTFMYDLYEKIESNHGHFAKEIFNDCIEYDRHQRGWIVDWDSVCYELENVCIEELMPEVSAQQPPVKSSTQKKKSKYGYGSETLYASGQLVQSIHVEVL